jgi:alkanesulfonate monooxygenase SsuD/methylene tetrahydromethanopterin reductase-like flavin-dependent oxidoreductase (luciferase family)
VPLLQEKGVFRTEYEGTTLRDHLGLRPLATGRQRSPGGRRVKFLAISLIVHTPHPVTGEVTSTAERFREVLDNAVLAESWASTASAWGSGTSGRSSPPRRRSCSATSPPSPRIRLFTAVTTLSLLDPVRAYEDYATLDHLSGGRLDLIIGKGNGAAQRELFHVTTEDQWDRNIESYELFRRLWREDKVTWSGRSGRTLHEAETWPRPLQQPIRVWHGSATSERVGRPRRPLRRAAVLGERHQPDRAVRRARRYYRERWEHYGHDPAQITVGAGTAGFFARKNSQDALDEYRPIFEAHLRFQRKIGLPIVFETFEDYVERSSALIGSPQQIIEKVHKYHEQFGHSVLHLHADAGGLSQQQHVESLELFFSDIAPVLRREIPDPPFPWAAGAARRRGRRQIRRV